MTQETKDLQEKINARQTKNTMSGHTTTGFGIAMAMMMDMICCLLVGIGIGLFIQKLWNTSSLVIACFGLLGGIAGLFTVVQMGLHRGSK